MSGRPLVLVDIDEVLFPFAHAYVAFRARRGLSPIPEDAWAHYRIGEDAIPGHQSLMGAFFSDPVTLATAPVQAAVDVLAPLAVTHRLVGCTSRYADTEGPGTRLWVERWVPWLGGVEFTGWHPEAGRRSPKAEVTLRLGARALIDDSPVHLDGLPAFCRPVLVQRPAGVPSAPGALSWDEVAGVLPGL